MGSGGDCHSCSIAESTMSLVTERTARHQNESLPECSPDPWISSLLIVQKTDLRQDLLNQRRSLPSEAWQDASLRLCQQVQATALFQQAKTILAYVSVRREPDITALWALPKVWGLPRCEGEALVWHRWSLADPLVAGRYGLQEPAAELPTLTVEEVDLMLVPCVACDRQGYRLGYGGGYYDRLLADPAWAAKPTIGLVFEFAYLPALPSDPWDKPLTWICTEQRSHPC